METENTPKDPDDHLARAAREMQIVRRTLKKGGEGSQEEAAFHLQQAATYALLEIAAALRGARS